MKRLVAWHAALLASLAMAADPPAPAPGEYTRQGDTGTLAVRNASGKLTFEIDSTGGNCHMCGITGTIEKGVGHGDPWAGEKDSKCYLSFTRIASGYAVAAKTGEECRAYCGARAGFDGDYNVPPKGCAAKEQKETREKFLDLYRSRRYGPAAALLAPLLAQCGDFMDWITMDRVRNDLALAELRAGDAVACLKALEQTSAWQYKDEEALREGLPPCDFDNYVDVAKITWFNHALCEKPGKK